MRKPLLLSIAAFAWASHSIAQENCVELAKTIGINYSKSLDVDQQRTVAKADLCSESYSKASSSKQAQLQASYKLFSGSGSAAAAEVQEAQSRHCENRYGEYWRNQISSGEARTVSNEGAAVISTCLSMAADSLHPTLDIANEGREVTMAIQYKPTIQSEIQITLFGPMDLEENKCSVTKQKGVIKLSQPADVSQVLKPTESITISCTRPSHPSQQNGVSYNCTKETIFNIATSGPVKAIKVPRVCSETIQESRADKIENRVQVLGAQMATLQASLKALAGVTAIQNECGRNADNQINCNAKCSDNERVVSGMCTVLQGGGNIQNFGLSPSTNEWHCLWSGNTTRGRTVAFCAPR
ncbi:hypothetical protein [Bradyrhizobium icense]|uniref:DUF1311 domain-containing protein n=1 Tax=Bradyrhizobium icense TaxID=1274631 RepID=A0A1B1U9H6_9BRAD|nr:hypothetical protein [Bradyrhizobium icense]ANV99345.1 hypothetical protein LMTR13_03290 [Bradyrhizobium icense]